MKRSDYERFGYYKLDHLIEGLFFKTGDMGRVWTIRHKIMMWLVDLIPMPFYTSIEFLWRDYWSKYTGGQL